MAPSDQLVIRTGVPTDAAALAEFGATTFAATYAADAPAEALDDFVDRVFGHELQAAELADPACCFLVAFLDGELVGYVLLRDVAPPTNVPGRHPMLLARFYVHPAVQGQGIGGRLLDRAVCEARSRDHDVLWLTVWERNLRAIAVYQRWGFSAVGEIAFDLAGVAQTDRLLVLDCGDRVSGC